MNRKPEAQDALGRAIASYSATTKEAPDDLDALRGLGEALGNQARIAYEMGRTTDALHSIEKAVPIYEEVVRRSPRDLSARVGLGRLLLNHGYYASNLNLLESSGALSKVPWRYFKSWSRNSPTSRSTSSSRAAPTRAMHGGSGSRSRWQVRWMNIAKHWGFSLGWLRNIPV